MDVMSTERELAQVARIRPLRPAGDPRGARPYLRPAPPPEQEALPGIRCLGSLVSALGRGAELSLPAPGFRHARPGSHPRARMVPAVAEIGGGRWRYALSGNALRSMERDHGRGPEPLAAVSLHGYFAGGGMYWRESARLADAFGWRVLNPSLPGFGGSDQLAWPDLSMGAIARGVAELMDRVGIERAILLGHSMGGAVAVQFATDFPERTLGIIYRDGAATGAWKHRYGPLVDVMRPAFPDLAGIADIALAAVMDVPDLVVGRLRSTIRSVLPDARRNVRTLARTVPVGALLLACEMTAEVDRLSEMGDIPLLPVWGCFDRIAHGRCAEEFAQHSGEPPLWVLGGHSWMLSRPNTQVDLLRYHPRGEAFLARVAERAESLGREAGRPPGKS